MFNVRSHYEYFDSIRIEYGQEESTIIIYSMIGHHAASMIMPQRRNQFAIVCCKSCSYNTNLNRSALFCCSTFSFCCCCCSTARVNGRGPTVDMNRSNIGPFSIESETHHLKCLSALSLIWRAWQWENERSRRNKKKTSIGLLCKNIRIIFSITSRARCFNEQATSAKTKKIYMISCKSPVYVIVCKRPAQLGWTTRKSMMNLPCGPLHTRQWTWRTVHGTASSCFLLLFLWWCCVVIALPHHLCVAEILICAAARTQLESIQTYYMCFFVLFCSLLVWCNCQVFAIALKARFQCLSVNQFQIYSAESSLAAEWATDDWRRRFRRSSMTLRGMQWRSLDCAPVTWHANGNWGSPRHRLLDARRTPWALVSTSVCLCVKNASRTNVTSCAMQMNQQTDVTIKRTKLHRGGQ